LASRYPKVKITTFAASVIDYDRVSSIIKEIGKIDIIILNAAVAPGLRPTKDVPITDVENAFAVNVIAPFHAIKEFLSLPASGPRTVIYVSSGAAQMAMPGNSAYGASKAAANILLQQFANDHKGMDVTVQSFHPGAIYTELAARAVAKDFFNWEDRKSIDPC
jgi:NAD(P)-dependent dehydrogenase (short-subunit alcohol dehydrogenase family)